ncbi:hypothetical protein CYMTET_12771 [Cymbomonas tetramitiformis]|uniref:U3 small nucleolar RNA-associated protein 13 C-terminal domain-containing protein n=1 Tax=Cymbomonas tetramitiformis TaxID=36881 RepID=A0AAE0GJR7_9CHLO|nr:hypothetical protein CYMTET_12771 [Cymbomonas tetramitiformis]
MAESLQTRKSYKVSARSEPFFTGGAVQLSPNGELLACTCSDEVKLVSLTSGACLKSLPGDTELITALTFTPNGKTLFTASRSLAARQWDVDTGEAGRTWKMHDAPVAAMAVDTTSTLLATGSADRSARVWDINEGHCTHSFRGHKGIVLQVLFHPEPRRLQLFTSTDDSEVKIWDLKKRVLLKQLDGHFSAVPSLAISPCGGLLLSGGRDKVVHVWDLVTLKKTTTVPTHESLEGLVTLPCTAAFPGLPSSKKKSQESSGVNFVTVGSSGLIRIWSTETAKCVLEVSALEGLPTVEKNSDTEAAGLEASHQLKHLQLLPGATGVICSTGDARILVFGPAPAAPQTLALTKHLIGTSDDIIDVCFFSSRLGDSKLAVVSNSEQVRIHDTASMACETFLLGHTDTVLCIAASQFKAAMAGGETTVLATGSKDNSFRVWNAEHGTCLGVGEGHVAAVSAVAFANRPGSNFAVTGGADKLIKVWDLSKLAELEGTPASAGGTPVPLYTKAAVAAHDKDINALAVAPNDAVLCTASQDRTVKLWKLPELLPLATLKGHRRGVWCAAFSPTEQVVATGSGDSTIKLWGLAEGTCLRTFEGHTASVLKVAFITAGTQLVSCGADGLLKLWSVKTSECINTFDEHLDKVWGLAVSGGGARLATGGGDGRINLWEDCTAEEASAAEAATNEELLKAQALANAMHAQDWPAAVKLAFELKQIRRLQGVFQRLLESEPGRKPSGGATLQAVLGQLEEEQLPECLEYIREWNTNARSAPVAQGVLAGLLRAHPAEKLAALPGAQGILAAIQGYTQRHYTRIDQMVRSTFLLDYTLTGLQVLEELENELEEADEGPLPKVLESTTASEKLAPRTSARIRSAKRKGEESVKTEGVKVTDAKLKKRPKAETA